MGTGAAQGDGGDLLVVALPGVQWFIKESRSTADVAAASEIYAALAAEVIGSLSGEANAAVILPVASTATDQADLGIPNRIVVSLPEGTAAGAAGRVSVGHEDWRFDRPGEDGRRDTRQPGDHRSRG